MLSGYVNNLFYVTCFMLFSGLIFFLETGEVTDLSLDHDLGDEHGTGMT